MPQKYPVCVSWQVNAKNYMEDKRGKNSKDSWEKKNRDKSGRLPTTQQHTFKVIGRWCGVGANVRTQTNEKV